MNDEVLKLLRCVDTKQPLAIIDDEMLLQLNEAIRRKQVANRVGQTIDRPMSGALVNQDRTLLYPIFDGIPVLIRDEAIELSALELKT